MILIDIERGVLNKKLFCHALSISEDELYDFLYGSHHLDLKIIQKICDETIYNLEDLFETIK